jgi:hypothetical protein
MIQKQFQYNTGYQKPTNKVRPEIVKELETLEGFKKYLGKQDRNHDYMHFFAQEIEAKGVEGVLQEYVFAGKFVNGCDHMTWAEKQAMNEPTTC